VAPGSGDFLEKEHGDGISLFARAAAGDPNSQRAVRAVHAHEAGNDLLREEFKNLGIAEEAGDIDEQVLGEKLDLSRVLLKSLEIMAAVGDGGYRHAPLDAALQRAEPVGGEVVWGLSAQKSDDIGKSVLGFLASGGSLACTIEVHLPAVFGE